MAKDEDKKSGKEKIKVAMVMVTTPDGPVELHKELKRILDVLHKMGDDWTGTQDEFNRWQRAHASGMLRNAADNVAGDE